MKVKRSPTLVTQPLRRSGMSKLVLHVQNTGFQSRVPGRSYHRESDRFHRVIRDTDNSFNPTL